MLEEDTFNLFQECLAEKAVIAAQLAAESHFAKKLQAYQLQDSDPDEVEVARLSA